MSATQDAKYTVTYTNADGNEEQTSGDSLKGLSDALAAEGYQGPTLRVVDDAGFTVGWVNANGWHA